MARTHELEDLLGKTSNDGSTDAGRLTHDEWNSLVDIVSEVKGNAHGAIKGVIWKANADGTGGTTFTAYATTNANATKAENAVAIYKKQK